MPPTIDQALRLAPLRASDVQACANIESASYPPAVVEGASMFMAHLKHHPSYCWIAVDDGNLTVDSKVIGYVLCLPARTDDLPLALSELKEFPSGQAANTIYLHDLAVDPSCRERGAAQLLQQAVANLALQRDVYTINLTAVCGAWTFWERQGYSTIDEHGLSEVARARLHAYPTECGEVRFMQIDLDGRPLKLPTVEAPPSAAAPLVTSARALQLPAKFPAPRTRLAMRLDDIDASLLARELPPPYSIAMNDGNALAREAWATIIHAAGERPTLEEALAQYDKEFGPWAESGVLAARQVFVVDGDGAPVGTATAWFQEATTLDGDGATRARALGRVHWVSLVPAAQGQGLAKPMLAAVLNRLLELHAGSRIVLVTHTQAARAIAMYMEAGFVPSPLSSPDSDDIERFTEDENVGWKLLAAAGLPVEIPGTALD